MNRDSLWWWVVMLGGVFVTISPEIIADPASYGLPAAAVPYLRLAGVVIAAIGGKLATSPLPGKSKDDHVTPPR